MIENFKKILSTAAELECDSKFDSALKLYELAMSINPGHSTAFTRSSIIRFKLAFGNKKIKSKKNRGESFCLLSRLGSNGRFGNQLLQYGIANIISEIHELNLITNEWIGDYIFGTGNSVKNYDKNNIFLVREDEALKLINKESKITHQAIEIDGYFCGNPAIWSDYAHIFRKVLTPEANVNYWAKKILSSIKNNNKKLIAIHIRNGDFGYGRYWIAPCAWYKAWLKEIWGTLENPVLYISTDNPNIINEFSDYSPSSCLDFRDCPKGFEFYLDHWILRNSDFIVTSNSTFSGTAALLNHECNNFYRPDNSIHKIRPYLPWIEPVTL